MIPYLIIPIYLLIVMRKRRNTTAYVMICMYMIFLGYFRDKTVGTDVMFSYIPNFTNTTMNVNSWNYFTNFEPGFNYLIALWKENVSNDPMNFFGFIFLLFSIPYFFYIQKYCENPFLGLLLFFLLGYFFRSMNIMRQFFCLGLIIPSLIKYIEKGNTTQFLIVVIIFSFLFHHSCFIFLILPIINRFTLLNNVKWKIVLILFLCVSYLSFFFREIIVNAFLPISILLNNEKLEFYLLNADLEIGGITALMQTLFCIFMLLYYNDNKFNIFFIMFIFGCITFNIFSCFSDTAGRIGQNLMIAGVPAMANMCYSNKINSRIAVYKFGLSIYVIVYFVVSSVIKNYNECIPYASRLF